MSERVIYHCPPLRARISHAACLANRSQAKAIVGQKASPKNSTEESYRLLVAQKLNLRPCLTCPGVKRLATLGAHPPVDLGLILGDSACPDPRVTR